LPRPSNEKKRGMSSLFRFREERRYVKPPDAIWPFLSDTARVNELVGFAPYRVEEKPDMAGRVRRFARGKLGPVPVAWEESFGEWRENRSLLQRREFKTGPIRRFTVGLDLYPDGTGSRVVYHGEVECRGIMGLAAKYAGVLARESLKRADAIERMIREADLPGRVPGTSDRDLAGTAVKRRLNELVGQLAKDPAAHGRAGKLLEHLVRAPLTALRAIRPLALAKLWDAPPNETVELFLAAQRRGLVAMGWDLLCPRCRGAKARVSRLDELPQGAHCPSCNIDYARDFTRNVELTFRPEAWLRPLPEGELCLLGPGSTPHVKFQAEVAAQSSARFDLTLAPGPYRFRTIEGAAEANAEIGADGVLPAVIAREGAILLEMPGRPGEITLRNETGHPLFFLAESRNWASDALTGERVIAMPEFRRLCPEQLLRPGDNAEISSVTVMFTDLQGSTKLYDDLGDATAYRLVRDHFAYLAARVQRHRGAIVKTVGDAVMAVFADPAGAVEAALAIQDEVAEFNRSRGGAPIALKLGVHAGSCIAVTAGGVLDYFGATVNIASRLEHQCRAGEVILSEAITAESAAREILAGRKLLADSAQLRGVTDPVRFVRVEAKEAPKAKHV